MRRLPGSREFGRVQFAFSSLAERNNGDLQANGRFADRFRSADENATVLL
jgi:hypothetical protein